jgi:hypothetical protein
VVGIQFENASGRLENVVVTNIRNGDGSAQGLAIQVQGVPAGDASDTKRVDIIGNTIANFTRAGILADGYGVDVMIGDNPTLCALHPGSPPPT